MKPIKVLFLTLLALVAFAGNSILCRLALKQTRIDAASFTFVRILSGAAALWLILRVRNTDWRRSGNWLSALALFFYAAAFSFAYRELSVGTGALLLFGAVQATMILGGLRLGERFDPMQMVGLLLAISGLITLLFPGLSAPPLTGSILMLGAGVAWGIYSLSGKSEINPATATGGNFIRAVPFAALAGLATLRWAQVDLPGIGYAIVSGAITSGVGYVVWYSALPGLKATSAATVQLSVPVLAATGGILLLGEGITLRYLLASAVTLGGIALVIFEKRARNF